MAGMDPLDAPADLTAAHAWAHLVAVFVSQRAVWLAAGQEEGLTPPQAMSLMRLDADAPPRLGDLARFLRCDASQVTATADRLEERGFAERRTAAGDRRVKNWCSPRRARRQRACGAAFLTRAPPDRPAETTSGASSGIAGAHTVGSTPNSAGGWGFRLPAGNPPERAILYRDAGGPRRPCPGPPTHPV